MQNIKKGIRSQCKLCEGKEGKIYQDKNKKKIAIRRKKYSEDNKIITEKQIDNNIKKYKEDVEKIKLCTKCDIEKSIYEFYFRKERKQYNSFCIKCFNKGRVDNYFKRRARELIYNTNYYNRNIEKERKRKLSYKDNLSDGYIVLCLRSIKENIPTELIEMKREQIQLHRLLKEIKNECK